MPFAFTLPTTSSALLSDFFDSVTHPSLPLAATTRRSVLKDVLKKHKRLAPAAREGHLPAVQDAVSSYLPYLLALNAGAGFRDVGPEKLDVVVEKALEVEWRSTLSAALPGREPARAKLVGLHHEIAFTLATLAYTHSLLARAQLRLLLQQGGGGASSAAAAALTPEQRTATIATAMRHLLEAHGIHTYLLSLPSLAAAAKDAPVDIQPSTVSALAALALAEATIIMVAKDDPYVAAVAEERDASNTDWMFKPPTIPKVRAHLFARICLAAAEHALQAHGLLARSGGGGGGGGAGKLDEDLVKYAHDLRRTARAKAVRFLAIDAELSGKTGEALAWLKGARKELGLADEDGGGAGKLKGLRSLKQSWQERREDRKVEKGGEWGRDAGRFEEGRVLEMLAAKWERENSTVNVQAVPACEPLLACMPSGRDPHSLRPFVPPTLDPDVFAGMRAPPEPDEAAFRGEEEDSGEEREGYGSGSAPGAAGADPVGAFPGSADEYGHRSSSNMAGRTNYF